MNAGSATVLYTDVSCVIEKKSYPRIPLMLDSRNQIVEAPTNWFRYLVYYRRRATSSVHQYATHLRLWWDFIEERRIKWKDVDDTLLAEWRDLLLEGINNTSKPLNPKTVNTYISTVFDFYLWAESKGYVKGLIGEVDINKDFYPAITVLKSTNSKGESKKSTPLLMRTVVSPILHVPTTDEITKVNENLENIYANANLVFRVSLILLWMERVGLRRAEVLSLKIKHIPSWEDIDRLQQEDEVYEIEIIGKGNKKRIVSVSYDVLSETRSYIETERQEILNRFKKKNSKKYKDPEHIFLSLKTGLVMHPDTVSQVLAKAFKIAEVKGSGHRVRARYLTNLMITLLEAEYEKRKSIPDNMTILMIVAQLAGHNHIETLRPYLAIAKKSLFG